MPETAKSRLPLLMADHTVETAAAVIKLIERCRCDLSTEKRLQADIAQVLAGANIPFEREKRLSDQDIPDFLVDGGVVVECKMRGAKKMDVYKQLCRYAEYSEVRALVLASNVSMGLPPEIAGKPVFAAALSRGWM